MNNFRCDDCSHSFAVPGQNMPMVIEGGCPECGGHARPEPDQPSPTHGDGDGSVRNLVDPYTGDDSGGNPMQEGILGTTDGGFQNAMKRDESFASVRTPPTEWMNPMRIHPHASNQTPQMPWQFEVEEVAEPGMDNDDAEAKMNKDAGLLGTALGLGSMLIPGAGLGAAALRMAAPTLMRAAVGQGIGAAAKGLLGGGGAPSMPPQTDPGQFPSGLETPQAAPQAPVGAPGGSDWFSPTASAGPDLPGGGTPGDGPKDTEDPERVDPHEKNDGDNKDWQKDVSVNGMGGTDSPHGLDEHTPGLESLQMLLPLVVHYAESPDSAMEHPLLAALHDLLGQEGHLEGPDDHEGALKIIQMIKGDGGSEADKSENELPKAEDVEGEGQSEDQTNQPSKTAADHQGPHSPDQVAAVAQKLVDEHGYPPDLAMQTANDPTNPLGAQILAEITRGDLPSPDVTQPQPTQEEAPPGDTMPMPGMTAPPPGQFGTPTSSFDMGREPYDLPGGGQGQSFNCPNCHEGQMNTDTGECYRCGYTYPYDGGEVLDGHSDPHAWARDMGVPSMNSDWGPRHQGAHDHTDTGLNPQGVPAADQLQQQDPAQQQDSSGAWQTDDGQPLIVGEQYELRTPGVDIPDIVRVKAVKPDAVTLEFTGAYELGFAKEITRQEFNVMGYTISHVRGDEPEADSPIESQAPGLPEESSFGREDSHEAKVAWTIKEAFMPGGGGAPGGQCQQCGGPLQPTGECAGCERGAQAPGAGITPPQPAVPQGPQGGRPADPNTVNAQNPNLGVPGLAPGGANASRPPQSFSSVTTDPETGIQLDAEAQATIARLMRNAANDPKGDMDPKTAGAAFTPNEQRALIDEEGVARNADKLDLSNTHYQAKRDVSADAFLW